MATTRRSHERSSSNVSSEQTAPVGDHKEEGLFTDQKHDKPTAATPDPLDPANFDFSHIDEKKVLRKMDIRLLPMLALLYLLSFLDRGNIGNARIEGLTETLNMSGPQYNWCLTVFFFTYCAFEVPSNLMYVLPPPNSHRSISNKFPL